ncbi:MAG TPA: CBS domain-containing protein [Anaerolineales bacterium]|nr:CBS domain-containing protein [Anaerolineae bacterium]HIQ01129.1 CBS domain-containing protein [Anaerolineales bacterium]
MLVRDRMTPNPIVLRPGSDPLAGMALCKSGGFRRLPVVDEEGRLVGIVTENDLRLFLSTAPSPGVMQRQHRVEQVMRSPVITVAPDYPLEEAARLMIQHDIGGLPVVQEDGRLVGIITRSDIFAQFAEALGADTPSLRMTVRVPDRPGELAKLSGRIAGIGGNICSVVSHRPGRGEWMDLTLRVEGAEREQLLEALRADPAVEVLHVWQRKPSVARGGDQR